MKKKTVWSFLLALALATTTIGTSAVAFAAEPTPTEPATTVATEATEKEDAIWKQIEALGKKSDAIFEKNAALWAKVDEAYVALPEDYDFEGFDEAAFIRGLTTLTDAEKTALLADIKELNVLDTQMEALYAQLPTYDDVTLEEQALDKADPKVMAQIDALEQEYDRLCEKNADLWAKVDKAYFALPEDYNFENYDEVAFIRGLSTLTDAEKDALVADYNRLMELDDQLLQLYESVWGNSGCEGGICPL